MEDCNFLTKLKYTNWQKAEYNNNEIKSNPWQKNGIEIERKPYVGC